jgi:hypothetical protein
MEYAVEMTSGVTIYIPSFMKIASGIEKLIGGIRGPQVADRVSLL